MVLTGRSIGNGSFIVYGGTGVPFGGELDETVYIGRVVGDDVSLTFIPSFIIIVL